MFRTRLLLIAVIAVLSAIWICLPNEEAACGQRTTLPIAKSDSAAQAASAPFGIAKRIPWTTSRFRGSPDPPLPYRAQRVFPGLHFKNPTVLTNAPATERMFVAEQYGKIFSIPHDPTVSTADLFLDAGELSSAPEQNLVDNQGSSHMH